MLLRIFTHLQQCFIREWKAAPVLTFNNQRTVNPSNVDPKNPKTGWLPIRVSVSLKMTLCQGMEYELFIKLVWKPSYQAYAVRARLQSRPYRQHPEPFLRHPARLRVSFHQCWWRWWRSSPAPKISEIYTDLILWPSFSAVAKLPVYQSLIFAFSLKIIPHTYCAWIYSCILFKFHIFKSDGVLHKQTIELVRRFGKIVLQTVDVALADQNFLNDWNFYSHIETYFL